MDHTGLLQWSYFAMDQPGQTFFLAENIKDYSIFLYKLQYFDAVIEIKWGHNSLFEGLPLK